jgi:hypothetical protein
MIQFYETKIKPFCFKHKIIWRKMKTHDKPSFKFLLTNPRTGKQFDTKLAPSESSFTPDSAILKHRLGNRVKTQNGTNCG